MLEVKRKPDINIIKEYISKKYNFRYQNRTRELDEDSKSWGMIYHSEEEAIEEGSTILDGKSCTKDPYSLVANYAQYYLDERYVVLVFRGRYVEEGHDGEEVCKVEEIIEAFEREDFESIFKPYIDNLAYEEWLEEVKKK